jgi:3-hydroxyacyl-CoA dehydrogenase
MRIRKVAVLGAGVMGSGIAGHLANAGIPSLLLDIVPPKAAEGEATGTRAFRDKFAANALQTLGKAKPAPLFTARAVKSGAGLAMPRVCSAFAAKLSRKARVPVASP